jgi:hypothetical protein
MQTTKEPPDLFLSAGDCDRTPALVPIGVVDATAGSVVPCGVWPEMPLSTVGELKRMAFPSLTALLKHVDKLVAGGRTAEEQRDCYLQGQWHGGFRAVPRAHNRRSRVCSFDAEHQTNIAEPSRAAHADRSVIRADGHRDVEEIWSGSRGRGARSASPSARTSRADGVPFVAASAGRRSASRRRSVVDASSATESVAETRAWSLRPTSISSFSRNRSEA